MVEYTAFTVQKRGNVHVLTMAEGQSEKQARVTARQLVQYIQNMKDPQDGLLIDTSEVKISEAEGESIRPVVDSLVAARGQWTQRYPERHSKFAVVGSERIKERFEGFDFDSDGKFPVDAYNISETLEEALAAVNLPPATPGNTVDTQGTQAQKTPPISI